MSAKSDPQFVATAVIEHGNARAYNPGDPVPAANVALHGYDKAGLVARVGTKAADEAAPDEAAPDEAGPADT